MNNQDETGRRDERQGTLERHKGRAKEMVRGSQGAPESRSAEPARGGRPEAERGSRGGQERGGGQERPGIAERIRMARSQQGQDQRSRV